MKKIKKYIDKELKNLSKEEKFWLEVAAQFNERAIKKAMRDAFNAARNLEKVGNKSYTYRYKDFDDFLSKMK